MKKINSRGMSLIETLIATSVVLIISMGIATMLINLQKEKKKQSLLQNLMLTQSRFESLIKNETSWRNTVQDVANNASFECLRQRKKCDGDPTTGISGNFVNSTATTTFVNLPASQIVLRDGANQIVYDGRQATNTQGFTEQGTVCNNFSYNTTMGNDSCAIGYIINWRAMSAEDTPQLLISAKLVFNPSDSHPMKKFINATVSSTTYNKYDVKVVRTANSLAKGFFVVVPFVANAGDCNTQGFGTCSTSPIVFTNYTGYSELNSDGGADPYDLVQAGGATIRIKAVGVYKCTVFTSAFAVNTVNTEIYRTNPSPATLASQQSYASTNMLNYVNISFPGLIEITTANTDIIIRQRCQSLPSLGPPGGFTLGNPNNCALGFVDDAANFGPGKKISKATLNCIKVE